MHCFCCRQENDRPGEFSCSRCAAGVNGPSVTHTTPTIQYYIGSTQGYLFDEMLYNESWFTLVRTEHLWYLFNKRITYPKISVYHVLPTSDIHHMSRNVYEKDLMFSYTKRCTVVKKIGMCPPCSKEQAIDKKCPTCRAIGFVGLG